MHYMSSTGALVCVCVCGVMNVYVGKWDDVPRQRGVGVTTDWDFPGVSQE